MNTASNGSVHASDSAAEPRSCDGPPTLTGLWCAYRELMTQSEELAATARSLEGGGRGNGHSYIEPVLEAITDQMLALADEAQHAQAHSFGELVDKAQILLDWCGDRSDVTSALAASLCHDIVQLARESR